ncbi:MAG: kumamolisin [Actinomycetota bacterium]|nr:kumamolisin [Actinomycetota bacterium]
MTTGLVINAEKAVCGHPGEAAGLTERQGASSLSVSESDFVALPGGVRRELPRAAVTSRRRITVTLVLRRRSPIPDQLIEGPDTLGRELFAERHGADPVDVEIVRASLKGLGLEVGESDLGTRKVVVSAQSGTLVRVFGTKLHVVHDGERVRTGELWIPAELDGIVVAVLGLDDGPGEFLTALAAAVHAEPTPPVLDLGGTLADEDWTGQERAVLADVLADAAALGIKVVPPRR